MGIADLTLDVVKRVEHLEFTANPVGEIASNSSIFFVKGAQGSARAYVSPFVYVAVVPATSTGKTASVMLYRRENISGLSLGAQVGYDSNVPAPGAKLVPLFSRGAVVGAGAHDVVSGDCYIRLEISGLSANEHVDVYLIWYEVW